MVAPFIVVNDQDARVAWSFTVLHELTHIWLGATGVSGGSTDARVESYCNRVAGEILLPESEVGELRFLRNASVQHTIEAVAQFAKSRKISRAMVAYKLLRASIISHSTWHEVEKYYEDERLASLARSTDQETNTGGPSYYVVKRHRLGHALLDLVRNSLAEGALTHTKAGQILGVKPRNVDPLIYATELRGGQ
jgi:Zn-dependent peptidase ImmA (M78 family)